MRDTTSPPRPGDGGENWAAAESATEFEAAGIWQRHDGLSLRGSPLTRKIVTFNLIAICVFVSGILYLNSSRDSLAKQRAASLYSEAELIANTLEVQLPDGAPVSLATKDNVNVTATLKELDLRNGVEVFVFDQSQNLVARIEGQLATNQEAGGFSEKTYLMDGLSWLRSKAFAPFLDFKATDQMPFSDKIKQMIGASLTEDTQIRYELDDAGATFLAVVTPVLQGGQAIGAVAVVTAAGEIDNLVRVERERVLQIFVIGALVSIGLSRVLASTIANPLADLSAAAELGRDKNARKMNPGRIRIPDLTSRPDEIGRLSGALRGMVSALYNRIDGNEQFAADVAHEIKNPLASLRSAVGTLRMVKREDQREKLLDVIDHDVRRLDRLVSDISNASRLDSELVKEEEEPFDVLITLANLAQHLGNEAKLQDIDFIVDLPEQPIIVHGLEARLAQVFVNLISNAISFCDEGDAIRIWARKKDNRALIVVEDTGPGIPDQALAKIFKRFYSQRPEEHFGNNSGLGLAISKQIVEAHGGVIWAENIRPTEADITSDPLGARFVVGLPI